MTDCEMDAWLAEHLFGWVLRRSRADNRKVGEVFWCSPEDADARGATGRRWFLEPDEPITTTLLDNIPAYSSTGDGMLLVLEAMRPQFEVEMRMDGALCGVEIARLGESPEGESLSYAEGPSLPRAVAEAAHAALTAAEPGQGEKAL